MPIRKRANCNVRTDPNYRKALLLKRISVSHLFSNYSLISALLEVKFKTGYKYNHSCQIFLRSKSVQKKMYIGPLMRTFVGGGEGKGEGGMGEGEGGRTLLDNAYITYTSPFS